jgi:sulfide:quinone oxidoreductase
MDKLLLAEFSGYTMDPLETFEGMIEQKKEQSVLYPLKTTAFPWLYWNRMLNGKWDGPRKIRNAIQGVWVGGAF